MPIPVRSSNLRFALAAIVLFAATLAIFAQTIDDEWHFDDHHELQWPGVESFQPSVRDAHYRGAVSLYLLALNARISGENGWSYHVVSIFLHFINSMLVYTIAAALMRIAPIPNAEHGESSHWVAL